MRFDSRGTVDVTDPESRPVVQPITLKLVQQERAERLLQAQASLSYYQELLEKPEPYRIGVADVLSIIVWDHPELVVPNLTYTIGASGAEISNVGLAAQTLPGYAVGNDGNVQFPYVGRFKAGGLTELEAQQQLVAMLKKYIRDPQITLRVIGYRSRKVYVDGEVRSAGVKPMTDVPMSLAEALNQAGGISPSGDPSRITLTRGARNYRISIPELTEHGISPSRVILQSEDLLRVTPLADNQIVVAGEVRDPRGVPLRSNGRLTLSDALSQVGGVLAETSDPSAIYVVRAAPDGAMPEIFHLDSKSPVGLALAENFELKAKDVVYVDAPGLVRFSRIMALFIGSSTNAVNYRNAVDKNN
ncbi:polysaccharide biosynthesis/export family protein [Collimonas sp.]|uniref:polysaccharide biosynthesis/export family protein n=1 Tax=Collimonas sp. TaxID=1963772 RepID=UPI002BE46243|nr:polysaccharide biosynthesis/export family protein [Collimonas sp.]HWX00974.1 polysaccharide biosynthesis/export family protein [Collimonas sp.]